MGLTEEGFYEAIEEGKAGIIVAGIQQGLLNDPVKHLEALKHAIYSNQIEAFQVLADHQRPDRQDIFEYRDNFGNALIHWMAMHAIREIPFVEHVAKRMKNIDIATEAGDRAVELFAKNEIMLNACDADIANRTGNKTAVNEFGSEILLRFGAKPTPEGVDRIRQVAEDKLHFDRTDNTYSDIVASRKRLIKGLELALDKTFVSKAVAGRANAGRIDHSGP